MAFFKGVRSQDHTASLGPGCTIGVPFTRKHFGSHIRAGRRCRLPAVAKFQDAENLRGAASQEVICQLSIKVPTKTQHSALMLDKWAKMLARGYHSQNHIKIRVRALPLVVNCALWAKGQGLYWLDTDFLWISYMNLLTLHWDSSWIVTLVCLSQITVRPSVGTEMMMYRPTMWMEYKGSASMLWFLPDRDVLVTFISLSSIVTLPCQTLKNSLKHHLYNNNFFLYCTDCECVWKRINPL